MHRLFLLLMMASSISVFADRAFVLDGTISAGRETILVFPKIQFSYSPSSLPGSYFGVSVGSALFSGHIGLVVGYEIGDLALEVAASETMSSRATSQTKEVAGDYYAFSVTPKICYRFSWLPLSEEDLTNETIRTSYSGLIPFLIVRFGTSAYFVQQYPEAANLPLLDRLTPFGIPLNFEIGFGAKF